MRHSTSVIFRRRRIREECYNKLKTGFRFRSDYFKKKVNFIMMSTLRQQNLVALFVCVFVFVVHSFPSNKKTRCSVFLSPPFPSTSQFKYEISTNIWEEEVKKIHSRTNNYTYTHAKCVIFRGALFFAVVVVVFYWYVLLNDKNISQRISVA